MRSAQNVRRYLSAQQIALEALEALEATNPVRQRHKGAESSGTGPHDASQSHVSRPTVTVARRARGGVSGAAAVRQAPQWFKRARCRWYVACIAVRGALPCMVHGVRGAAPSAPLRRIHAHDRAERARRPPECGREPDAHLEECLTSPLVVPRVHRVPPGVYAARSMQQHATGGRATCEACRRRAEGVRRASGAVELCSSCLPRCSYY